MMNNYNSLSSRFGTWLKNGIGDSGGSPPTSRSKTSWLVMLLLLLTVSVGHRTWAQNIGNYVYSTDTNGTLEDLSTGSTVIMTGVNDDTAGTTTAIGFDFYFMGAKYTHFSANSNGQFRLHNSATATAIASNVSSLAANTVTLAPFSGDNEVNNGIRIKVVGTAPNRKLVIEWNQFYVNYVNLSNAGNMQAWLEESTGAITYIYGDIYNSATTSQTRSIFISSSNTANTAGSITIAATPTFAASATLASNTIAAGANPVGLTPIANIGSTTEGSRRFFKWTPSTTVSGDVTTLTFSAISTSATTVNWVDNATNEVGFIVTRATDAAFTQNVVNTQVATTTSAGTGTAYTSAQTGLTAGTTYYYKVQALVEGSASTGITGSQDTTAATTYYYVGTASDLFSTAANWNTQADGLGTPRAAAVTTTATTDIFVIDGAGTTPGGSLTVTVGNNFPIGQLKITNNTNLTLRGLGGNRTLTLSGSPGDDFVLESGSTLNLDGATGLAAAIAFSGTGNTGLIAGTYNVSGSNTSNTINSTGGTGTLVTVSGTVNNSLLGASGCLTGSVATMSFTSTASYTHTAFTTTSGYVPSATWDTASNVYILGGTTGTGVSGASGQSFGNFTYNSTTNAAATVSVFTSGTSTVKGNLNVIASGTGKFRALTTGTLTVQGNLNVSGGTFEVSSSTGTLIVNGNVNISGGTFDVAQGGASTLRVLGNFVQTAGTIIQTSTTGLLDFAGTVAQDLTLLSGAHGTNAVNVRVNNAAGVNLTADMSIRNLTLTNGSVTGTGVLSYGASSLLTYNSSTGAQIINNTEFPATNGPASLTINNTTASPNNTVTLNAARSLGATGVLTLTNGFLVNGANTLTVLNPAVGGISGGSATAHVKGALSRDLASGLVSGSTYNFPVGATGYNPFALVNPTTNAGANVNVKITLSDSSTSGTATGLLASLNTDRSWLSEVTDAGGNFTGSLVRLTDTPGAANAVGFSADGGLTYNLVGGTTSTVTATDITSTAPAATNINGYFAMGTKADPPVLSDLAISPTGNQCTNVTRDVTITVTPGAAAVTGVVINYSVNGVAQSAISMTNTSGNAWSGTIPTVTPANATVAWSVTATDANGITASQSGTSYTDEPNFGYTPTATLSDNTLCAGESSVLTASLIAGGVATVGAGGTTSSSTAASFFPGSWGGAKTQYIIKASELTAAGLGAGAITSLGFDVTSVGQTYQGFRVQLGHTTAANMTTTFLTDPLTQVYLGTLADDGYLPTVGVNTLAFGTGAGSSSSFVWDGTSNIVVNICWSRVPSATTSTSSTMKVDATGFTSSVYEQSDSLTPADMCAKTVGDGTGSNRPQFRFNGVLARPLTSVSWSDGSTEVGTTNPLTVSPSTSTNYTASIVANGCTLTTNTVALTVNPLPTAPTASDSSQCGTQVPTASVADPNGFTTPTIKWYADNVTTTALQTGTSNTYTTAVSSTTTFYVSVVNPTTLCESSRTAVTVTVATPETITMTPSSGTVCQNGTIALGASSVAGYTYSWTASPEAGSGITNASPLTGSSVNVTPTGTGSYTYTATGVEGSCTATNTVVVTITPAPVLTISASTSAVCPGGSATLTATTPVITTGSATLGAGATASSSTAASFFPGAWGGAKTQYIVKASELTAAGITAGPITSLGFDVTVVGQTYQGFRVQLGHTSATSMTTTFLTDPLTQVYLGTLADDGYLPTVGVNTLAFGTGAGSSSSFVWDGTSNIVVNICWSRVPAATTSTSSTMKVDATGFTCSAYEQSDSTTPEDMCAKVTADGTGSNRPQFIFNAQLVAPGAGTLAYSWNDPSSTTGNVVTVNPTSTTTYTVAGYDSVSGCTGYQTTTVTVNTPPTAPTATNASQCGAGVPTASVADTNGFASPIYTWYADNVTTTALQTGASATYTTSISETTTFYVSVTSATAGCESERTPVTVTVNTPATISASSDVAEVCVGDSATLTAAVLTGTVNSYAWTPSATLSASSGDTVVATPTATTTYSVVGTDSNNCTTVAATVTVTVNEYPSTVSIAQSPLTLCAGSVATLTASGGTISNTGSTKVGTGTAASSSTSYPTAFGDYWYQDWQQFLFTSDELNALGITAGSINSITFDINGLPSANVSNYNVKIGTTANATLAGFVTTGLTDVYGPALYTATVGANTITFSVPYNWDGTSNIIIDVRGTGTYGSANATTQYTTTSGKAIYAYSSTNNSSFWTSSPSATTTTSRPNITFGYTAITPTTITWSPQTNLFTDAAATVAYTGDSRAVVYTNTSGEQTYTVTASNGTCSVSDDITVSPNPLPSFTTEGITICKGETGELSAISGESNTYSWTPVGGGTTLTGVNVSVSPLATTTYNVVATSNITACQSSQEVTVTVSDPGQIISGTTERTVSPDVPTTFEVVTTGTGLTYQWQVNDGNGWVDLTDDYVDEETGNYSGVNTAILTVDNITIDFNGYLYQCIVTGGAPCVSLEPIEATLNVSDTGFLVQPANVTVCGTSTAEFTIVTSGDEPFNVQWQVSTDGGASFQDIIDGPDATITGLDFTGANEFSPKTLSVSGITTDHDGYQFLCQLNFGLNSTIATLDVKTPVAVTTHPEVSQTVCYSGGTTSFTAAASGDFSGVQWQYSADGATGWSNVVNGTPAGATYANATTTTLGITTTAATTSGYYRANFIGSAPCGDVATDAGQLLINTPNVAINASATAFCLPSGNAITLTASGASTYTWSPATGLSDTTGASVFCSPSATTTYTVTGDDGTGCTNTAQVTITVGSDLTATATATPAVLCSGSNSQLDVAVTEANATPFVQKYAFQATTGTYTEVSGSATALSTVLADFATSTTQNIGFNFVFDGVTYTQFRMASDGFISFNTSSSTTGTNNLSSASSTNRPLLAPLWDDMDGRPTGSTAFAGYEVTGTAPNRVLTVEWRNWEWNYAKGSAVISYQTKLYEGTNVIEYVYRSEAGTVNSGSATIGIATTGTGAGSYINLTSVSTPAVSSSTSTTNLNTKPATGTVYRFTPAQLFTYSWSPSTFIEGQTSLKNPVATGVTAPIAYTVTVTNAAGCSTTATTSNITLEGGPVITAQPSPLVVTKCQGEAASFSVTATGPSLSYQWRKNGQPITGNASATTATLTLTGTTPADSASYDVVISACTIDVISDAVALTVYPTPTLTTTLSSASYCEGATVPGISFEGTPSGVTFDVTGGSAVGLSNQTDVTSIPSFTATTGSATITVTPKANGCTGTAVTYTITVNGLPTALSVSPASQTICSNDTPVLLTATGGVATGGVAFGTGTSVNTTTGYPSPLTNYYGGTKHQMLIRASELTALGFTAGDKIKAIAFDVSAVGSSFTGSLSDFSVAIGNTANTTLTTTFVTGLTTVRNAASLAVPTTSLPQSLNIPFDVDFTWNGTSNIVIQTSYSNVNSGTSSDYVQSRYTTTAFVSTNYYRADSVSAASILGATTATSTTSNRPNFVLTREGNAAVTWTPTTGLYTDAAGTVAYTGTNARTVYARPTTSTSYVAKATTTAGCFVEASASSFTVNPAPTVTASYDCSGTSFTANAVPGSAGSYTYAWTVPAGFTNPGDVASFVSSTPGTYSVVITNTVTNCNSSSASFTVTYGTLYQDADGDGYGNPDVSIVGCSQPGYVSNNTDCDDTIFAVNPGVTEILYNGVDDNCSGVMDEGYQITANMVNCGTTLSTLSSFIYCVSTPGVNGYRFEVTNTTTNEVQTIDRPTQYFSLTQLSSYDYATTYSVRVMVRKSSNNVWLGYYGPACLYSTPPVVAPSGGAGTTQLQTYCGETLPTISTIISTTSLAGATGYRFRVTNTTTGAVQTLTRTIHWFSLTMLSSYNYGTTYAVDVAVKTTGDYSDYGAPCNVTTPAVPTLVNYCGGAVVPTKGAQIRTSSLDKVTAYEFTVDRYNASLELVSSSVVVKSLNRFTFNDITNYAAATTYSVRVRVFTAGSWSPYGDACEIVSPGAAKQGDTKAVDSSLFSVVAYPNPYDYQFSFRMESSSDAPVHVKVYDMIGKLIETREINAADMSVVSLGERYPSGVYNVVVTQEDNVKTLRLVKR